MECIPVTHSHLGLFFLFFKHMPNNVFWWNICSEATEHWHCYTKLSSRQQHSSGLHIFYVALCMHDYMSVYAWLYVIEFVGRRYQYQRQTLHRPCQVNMEVLPVSSPTSPSVLITWTEPMERKNTQNYRSSVFSTQSNSCCTRRWEMTSSHAFPPFNIHLSSLQMPTTKQVLNTVSTQPSLQTPQLHWPWVR